MNTISRSALSSTDSSGTTSTGGGHRRGASTLLSPMRMSSAYSARTRRPLPPRPGPTLVRLQVRHDEDGAAASELADRLRVDVQQRLVGAAQELERHLLVAARLDVREVAAPRTKLERPRARLALHDLRPGDADGGDLQGRQKVGARLETCAGGCWFSGCLPVASPMDFM